MAHPVSVYSYPCQLTKADVLVDGPAKEGRQIKLLGNTMLIWIDLGPDLKFAHATQYILITSEGARVENGSWWPVLNGKKILLGENPAMISSPFAIGAEEFERKQVKSVDEIDFKFLLTYPGQLLISCVGTVPGPGWKNFRLEPFMYVRPPADGIWDFGFVGDAPLGQITGEPEKVRATHLAHSFAGWKGVRIHAESNCLVKMFASSDIPATADMRS